MAMFGVTLIVITLEPELHLFLRENYKVMVMTEYWRNKCEVQGCKDTSVDHRKARARNKFVGVVQYGIMVTWQERVNMLLESQYWYLFWRKKVSIMNWMWPLFMSIGLENEYNIVEEQIDMLLFKFRYWILNWVDLSRRCPGILIQWQLDANWKGRFFPWFLGLIWRVCGSSDRCGRRGQCKDPNCKDPNSMIGKDLDMNLETSEVKVPMEIENVGSTVLATMSLYWLVPEDQARPEGKRMMCLEKTPSNRRKRGRRIWKKTPSKRRR